MDHQKPVSFDRASDFYERTRALEPEVMDRLVGMIAAELEGRKTLEMGAGTGRFTRPLAAAGIDLVALDISPNMLGKLVESDRSRTIGAVLADATKMPFHDAPFDAVLGIHVLHLIPDWRAAVDEAIRVTRPGGILLFNLGGWGRGIWKEIQLRFCEGAGIQMRHVGVNEAPELDEVLAERGATLDLLPETLHTARRTFGEMIDVLERGVFSFTWRAEQPARTHAAQELRKWLTEKGASLDEPTDMEHLITWRRYTLPA